MSGGAPNTVIDGCSTLPALFLKRVQEHPDTVALREKDFGIWNEYTWSDWGEQSRLAGLGLMALGLQRGDRCSVASEINREWIFTDLAILCAGGITNGVYPTDAPSQVEFLINDSGSRFYFAEDEEQLDKVLQVREQTPTLEKIIIFDMEGLRALDDPQCISFDDLLELGRQYEQAHPRAWDAAVGLCDAEDIAVLTYTSGTTGAPKGAMISNRNLLFQASTVSHALPMHAGDEQIGFLPLAHIAGRIFYILFPIVNVSRINLVESLDTTVENQQQVEPNTHFGVPRVWEKQHSTIAIMLKEGTPLGRWAYRHALALGERVAEYRLRQKPVPLKLRIPWAFASRFVVRNVRKILGIDRARWLVTAAAPIAPELIRWYWSLGVPMFEAYGQTECTGLATGNVAGATRFGSVGRPLQGCEVRISDSGEILIRSPGVIQGYWNQEQKTAETIIDGWLHTGDVGRIDEDGFVYILDRLKDIIITAGGKNITPSEIENQLKFSAYISDAVVVGDRRPYLTCLVMIDHENVTKYAQDLNVPFTNYTSLCHTREVQDLVWREIEQVNARFARVETIKKFRLIDQLLDPEDEELTPTMKLKRNIVNEKYIDLIESMYKG